MGGEWLIFWKPQFSFSLPFNRFFLDELQLQFPFQFVSCNSGNQLTESGQLLISAVTSPLQTVTSTLPTVTHRFLSFFHRFLPFPTIISFTWILWQQEIRKTYKMYTNQSNKTNNKYTVSVFGASQLKMD